MDKKEFDSLGKEFHVNKDTLLYGITPRLGSHFAERFKGLKVLETRTGAGFLTMEFAKVAEKATTIDINKDCINQAKHNAKIEGMESKITFLFLAM